MNKILFVLPLFLFFSCYQDKLVERERTNTNLNTQISSLQVENENLKEEIANLNTQFSSLQIENENLKEEVEKYKLTDQFYYQSGADAFLERNYSEAIHFMNSLKIKFPTSSFLGHTEKIINDSKDRVDEYFQYYFNNQVYFNNPLYELTGRISSLSIPPNYGYGRYSRKDSTFTPTLTGNAIIIPEEAFPADVYMGLPYDTNE